MYCQSSYFAIKYNHTLGEVLRVSSTKELGARWENIFRTLVSATRRRIIGSLLESPPDRAVALPEGANNPESRGDPDELCAELHHCHLPKMERAGFIAWEREPFCVRRGPRFEEVAAVIMAIDTYEEFPQHLLSGCYFHEQNTVNT